MNNLRATTHTCHIKLLAASGDTQSATVGVMLFPIDDADWEWDVALDMRDGRMMH